MNLDETVRNLFAAYEKQVALVKESKRRSSVGWVTNCSYPLHGTTINLVTASRSQLQEIAFDLARMNSLLDEAGHILGEKISTVFMGASSFASWQQDVRKRLAMITIKEQEDNLAKLNERLNSVLSPEERRRIEIERLAHELLQ